MRTPKLTRRDTLALAAGALVLPHLARAAAPSALHEMGPAELAFAIATKRASCAEVTAACLARIDAIDRKGPALHSVIETNPEALEIARALDTELAKGPRRSLLHGVPVLVKDNVITADRMHSTAGSLALVGVRHHKDAVVVEKLRQAGCVIVGKANMSEWANIRSPRSISGWSARGGFTKNPHVLDRNPSGSSSGSAAAVAAQLVPFAVGTETDGSIVAPASFCGVVGFKPTLKRVSQAGIIPISAHQDTAGPIARSVSDAALLFKAMHDGPRKAMELPSLKGRRIAVRRMPVSPRVDAIFDDAVRALQAAGAQTSEIVVNGDGIQENEWPALLYETKAGLDAFLGALDGSPVRSLADLIAWNKAHADTELAHFGQETLEEALALGPLTTPDYLEKRKTAAQLARAAMQRALEGVDVVVMPGSAPATVTDPLSPDAPAWVATSLAAVAGIPSLALPMGAVDVLPVSMVVVGRADDDERVLSIGVGIEKVLGALRAPRFLPTIPIP